MRDMLQDAPGVYVQNRYGQEVRLSVRGSGISRAYHTRGIEILQDGIPMNLADGSGSFYQVDPEALQAIEILEDIEIVEGDPSAIWWLNGFYETDAQT